jgi:hypothetical protein
MNTGIKIPDTPKEATTAANAVPATFYFEINFVVGIRIIINPPKLDPIRTNTIITMAYYLPEGELVFYTQNNIINAITGKMLIIMNRVLL